MRDGIEFWENSSGQFHRENGPAIIYAEDSWVWYLNGKYHRSDGPAKKTPHSEEWYLNGKCHRTDGPALTSPDGNEYWYIDDEDITDKVHNRENWRNWSTQEWANFKLRYC